MHDDDPGDVVHDLFARRHVRRHPARPAGPRHRRLDQRADRDRDRRLLPRHYTPTTWWWPPPATSTTTWSSGWSAPAFERPARSTGADAAPPAPRDGPGAPAPPAGVELLDRRPSRPTWSSACPAWPAPTTAASRSACSTPRSAAACRSRLFQEIREKRGLAYSVYSLHLRLRRHRPVRRLRRLPARQGRRGARDLPRRARPVAADGMTDDEIAPRQGPDARLARARPGGHRLADDPDRQERAGLRRADVGRRGAGPDRRRHPGRGRARSPRDVLGQRPSLARDRPVPDEQAARLHEAVA